MEALSLPTVRLPFATYVPAIEPLPLQRLATNSALPPKFPVPSSSSSASPAPAKPTLLWHSYCCLSFWLLLSLTLTTSNSQTQHSHIVTSHSNFNMHISIPLVGLLATSVLSSAVIPPKVVEQRSSDRFGVLSDRETEWSFPETLAGLETPAPAASKTDDWPGVINCGEHSSWCAGLGPKAEVVIPGEVPPNGVAKYEDNPMLAGCAAKCRNDTFSTECKVCILYYHYVTGTKAGPYDTTTDDGGDESLNIPRSDIIQPYCLCTSLGGVCTTELNICIDQTTALADGIEGIADKAGLSDSQMAGAFETATGFVFDLLGRCICQTDSDGKCMPETQICSKNESPVERTDNDGHASSKRANDLGKRQGSTASIPPAEGNPDDGYNCVYLNVIDPHDDRIECFGEPERGFCDCLSLEKCSLTAKYWCLFSPSYGPLDHEANPDRRDHLLRKRQGVTALIAPDEGNPDNVDVTYNGQFGIVMIGAPDVNSSPPAEWSASDGECFPAGWFLMNLTDGVLTDDVGRRGYIASNNQLQFDDPPQAGARWTKGFFTANGVLGIGRNYTFDSCASGGFSNIYNAAIANYCAPVFLKMMNFEGVCDDSTTDGDSE